MDGNGGSMGGGNSCEVDGAIDSDCDGIIDESEVSDRCIFDSDPDCT
jgi:hypothetical protein